MRHGRALLYDHDWAWGMLPTSGLHFLPYWGQPWWDKTTRSLCSLPHSKANWKLFFLKKKKAFYRIRIWHHFRQKALENPPWNNLIFLFHPCQTFVQNYALWEIQSLSDASASRKEDEKQTNQKPKTISHLWGPPVDLDQGRQPRNSQESAARKRKTSLLFYIWKKDLAWNYKSKCLDNERALVNFRQSAPILVVDWKQRKVKCLLRE